MNPLLSAILVTLLIAGSIVLSFCLGHWCAKLLRKKTPTTLAGKFVRDYRFWAVLGGLLMCGCVLGSTYHVLVAVALLPAMCFAIVMADSFEPPMRHCGTCGR